MKSRRRFLHLSSFSASNNFMTADPDVKSDILLQIDSQGNRPIVIITTIGVQLTQWRAKTIAYDD